jgi:hypothetical protein
MKSNKLFRFAALASVLGAAASVPAGTITSEMVVHLPFDGDYVNLAPAAVVSAAPVGAPTLEAGRIGSGAVRVSTANDGSFFNYVTLGAPAELNFGGATDFTVSAWVKINSKESDPSFLSNKDWDAGGNTGWVVFVGGGGNLGWNYRESGSARVDASGPGINDGNWHHIAVSYKRDGNAITYLDGVLVATTPIGPAEETLDSGLPTNIGQDGTGAYGPAIDALIDDVAIWRRAVTGFELERIYTFGTNGVKVSDIPDALASTFSGSVPVNGAKDVRADTIISADIVDGPTALDVGTVQLTINGTSVVTSSSKLGNVNTISYQSPEPLNFGTNITAALTFNNGISLVTTQWSFTVIDVPQARGITAQWDFNAGDLSATIGLPLEYSDGPAGVTATGTGFGTTTQFGLPDIGGQPAFVMATKKITNSSLGYIMRHGARPNGDPTASKVNQWTMIMDILIPTEGWHSFIQIDNSGDGDLFVNPGNGLGISGSYQGSIVRGQWHRIAFAVDMTQGVISKFIDGVNVSDQAAGGLNGRWGLLPTALLFGDEDSESQASYVNSIQIRNYKMSNEGIAALGGPSPDGVPLVSGQWDFEAGNLAATIGTDLVGRPDTEFVTLYETAILDDGVANVMRFNYPATEAERIPLGYLLPHGILPNAGGEKVNQYTVIMDVMFPASSGGFRSLFQTETNNATDGDVFLNGGNGLGISSQYQGNATADTFHRIAFTVDLTKRELGKYIDGVNVVTTPVGSAPLGTGLFQYLSATDGVVDKRWSLDPLALIFADEDGETAAGVVNSIQTRPVVLSPSEIARLGKATAAGIPAVIPPVPSLKIVINEFGATFISWPDDVTGFILESSTSLAPGAVWTPVDNVFNNGYEEFRVPNPGIFYRLRKE